MLRGEKEEENLSKEGVLKGRGGNPWEKSFCRVNSSRGRGTEKNEGKKTFGKNTKLGGTLCVYAKVFVWGALRERIYFTPDGGLLTVAVP